MRLEKPYFSRPMHSMLVNINDFCYSLTVVAINIERGGSPHCQFNSFTVILVRLFVLWFCSFGLRVVYFVRFALFRSLFCLHVRVRASLTVLLALCVTRSFVRSFLLLPVSVRRLLLV